MPVRYEEIHAPFIGSVNDSVLDRLLPPGQFATIVNGEFDINGTLNKRPGFADFAEATDSTHGDVRKADTYKNQLLAVIERAGVSSFQGDRLLWLASYYERDDLFGYKARMPGVSVERRDMRSDYGETITGSDMCVLNGTVVYAWVENQTLRLRVVEESTGHVIVDQDIQSGTIGSLKVTPSRVSQVLITWLEGVEDTDLKGVTLEAADGIPSIPTTMFLDVFEYDVDGSDNDLWNVLMTRDEEIRLDQFDTFLTASAQLSVFASNQAFRLPAVFYLEDRVWCGYFREFDVLNKRVQFFIVQDSTAIPLLGPTDVEALGAEDVQSVGIAGVRSSPPQGIISYVTEDITEPISLPFDAFRHANIFQTGIIGAIQQTSRLHQVSKMFTVNFTQKGLINSAFSEAYMWVYTGREDAVSPKLFVLVHLNPFQRARPVATSGLGEVSDQVVARRSTVSPDSSFRFRNLMAYTLNLNSDNSADSQEVLADFDGYEDLQSTQFGTSQYFTGGVIGQWGGERFVENQFVHPPAHGLSTSAVGFGDLEEGKVYTYAVVYEAKDDEGNIHKSIPSNRQTVTATATRRVDVGVHLPSLMWRISEDYQYSTVQAAIYRSKGDVTGPLFRLWPVQLTPGALIVNKDSPAFTRYEDGASDDSIGANEQIYTEGGILANDAVWGGCRILEVHKDRLWAAGGERREVVWFSKTFIHTEAAGFSLGLQVFIPQERVVAMKSLDDALIIFTERKIYGVFGNGPNDTGNITTGGFTVSEISADTGCLSSRSVIRFRNGILFQGKEGIYLLNRGRQLSFIGQPVEQLTRDFPTCNGSTLKEIRGQVLWAFTQKSTVFSIVLLYDYELGRWSRWNVDFDLPIGDIALYKDELTLYNSSHLLRQSPLFVDRGSFYGMEVSTGRLNFGQIQGFNRLRRVGFLGERKDVSYGLRITIDYEPDYKGSQVVTYTSAQTDAWTLSRTTVNLKQPKGFSWRVTVTELEPDNTDDSYEGLSFSALSFQIGREGGLNRLGATQKE